MALVIVTNTASIDEVTILNELNTKAGLPTVVKFRTGFRSLYGRLADHPEIGAPRPRVGRGVRIGIVSPFIIIYRYTSKSDTVTVLRVVHGRRRITRKLLTDAQTQ